MPSWLEKIRVASGPMGLGGRSGRLQGMSWQEAVVGKRDATAVINNDGLGRSGWSEGRSITTVICPILWLYTLALCVFITVSTTELSCTWKSPESLTSGTASGEENNQRRQEVNWGVRRQWGSASLLNRQEIVSKGSGVNTAWPVCCSQALFHVPSLLFLMLLLP